MAVDSAGVVDYAKRSALAAPKAHYEEGGGEPACWAHLVCPDCNAIAGENHRPDCTLATDGTES